VKLLDFLKQTNLQQTLLLGYYGGGNYGDELLLEVLQNLLRQQGIKDVSIAYQVPSKFDEFHHDLGYKLVSFRDRVALLKAGLINKNIIVGGGGLWGVDMNLNTLIMSMFLFVNRYIFGKKIHLVGVGYYNSTNLMGHVGAWFAAKSANTILARDEETQHNFSKFTKKVYLDHDMAWYIKDVNLSQYEEGLAKFEQRIKVGDKTLFITLRRAQSKHQHAVFNNFSNQISKTIELNQDKDIIIGLLEAEEKSPAEFKMARKWAKKYHNVQILDHNINPLTLYLFFKKYQDKLALIGPQFHIIITAHLNNVPFMPLVYDNKVRAMLEKIKVGTDHQISIRDLHQTDVQQFIDATYQGARV
jgi:polysaccharide pyruvyl transferase WcaK-like protein